MTAGEPLEIPVKQSSITGTLVGLSLHCDFLQNSNGPFPPKGYPHDSRYLQLKQQRWQFVSRNVEV